LIIDATGDADIAAMANVPYDKNESLLQPGSMMFKMSNVEVSEAMPFIRSGQLFRLMQEVDQQHEYRLPRIDGSIIPQPREGQVIVGFSRVLVDGTDVKSLTMAEFEGRSQIKECARFLIERVPGFRHAFISEIPTQLGIRETRRIHGQYCLTKEDVLTGAKFEDSIGRCAWPIEQHIPGAKVTRLEFLDGDDYYNLPFRSLIPHGIGNLLVAGRCSSATGEAQASSRVFAPCTAQGQACGVGAFLSLKEGKPPEKVNIDELHSELEKQGVLICITSVTGPRIHIYAPTRWGYCFSMVTSRRQLLAR
jgi:hypothetical protein